MRQVLFHIHYIARADEALWVSFTALPSQQKGTVQLHAPDLQLWSGQLETPEGTTRVDYAYEVRDADGTIRRNEADARRSIDTKGEIAIHLFDSWADTAIAPECFRVPAAILSPLSAKAGRKRAAHLPAQARLCLSALPAPKGFRWAVAGSSPMLGNWRPECAVPLTPAGLYRWEAPLAPTDLSGGVQYKYVLQSVADPTRAIWEEGANRWLPTASAVPDGRSCAIVVTDNPPHLSLQPWRGAGVVVPVFSLRSEGSAGVGDFGDLGTLADWAASVGMHAVQILPVNDTTRTYTWRDSYPYNAISVFALHPLYLDLRPWRHTRLFARYAERAQTLNLLPAVDYEGVIGLKLDFLHDLYRQTGRRTLRSRAFAAFSKANAAWLPAYCQFCSARDLTGTANFRSWPGTATLRSRLRQHPECAPEFYAFTQFLLHGQLSAAHDHARQLGVILKGDIPIGISPDSVPAREEGHLFHFNGQAGAPPDAFATNGQNWGFPTYNWEAMAANGYKWWRQRFSHMAQYFDAYRIDHVLGFFRIWEIPAEQVYGTLGHFRPALPLTAGEIRSAGFTPPVALCTQPRLSESAYRQLIAEFPGQGAERCFCHQGGQYVLSPEASTQRRLLRLLPDGPLRKRLMDLVADVLFLPDPDQAGHYHPRVDGSKTTMFRQLSEADRRAYLALSDHFFYHRHNQFWAQEGRQKLSALTPSVAEGTLLPCAEDLGMVPECVPDVLRQLNILTLEIQSMPKAYGRRFADLSGNPYLSVATIATHDMPPLRLWWQQDKARTQAFWHDVLGREGEAPDEASPEVCRQVVRQHLDSPSMLCLLALQDWLATDSDLRAPHPESEQINVPANPDHNWNYRLHISLEQLFAATAFNDSVRQLIADSGR